MSGNRSWRISGLLQSLVRALGFTPWLVVAAVVLFACAVSGCGNEPQGTRGAGITQGLPIPPMPKGPPRTRDITQSDIVDVIARLESRVRDLKNDVHELKSQAAIAKNVGNAHDDSVMIVTDGKYFRYSTPGDGWISGINLETREEAEKAASQFKESYFGSRNKARWKSAEGDFTVKAPCVSDCCRCAVCTCTETHCVENCGGQEL